MSVQELINPSLTMEQIEQEQNSHYMRGSDIIDWEQLDEETVPLLEQIARDIYDGTASEIGRPERVSERMIYRELGLAQHRLENMPKCKTIFEKYTESYAENWARKIIWGYQRLQRERKDIYWSDIRQFTGVKKNNMEYVIPYLRKVTVHAVT